MVDAGAEQSAAGAATVEEARAAFARIGAAVDDKTGRVDRIAAAVEDIATSAAQVEAEAARRRFIVAHT